MKAPENETGGGNRMQDNEIVGLYLNRDEKAIEQSQKKYGRYLAKIAYNILRDTEDCKECVNEAYLAAWNSIPPHKPEVLRTYLVMLVRRICVKRAEKKYCQKRFGGAYAVSLSELEECISDNDRVDEDMELSQLVEAINVYLRGIPEEARSLFIGRYYYMDSLKKAAAYCGMSEAKAKSMLYRTRRGLREHLIKEGYIL